MAAYWEIVAQLAYNMFSKYKYLIVNLVFPTSVFGVGNFFLIAPFPDHCLLVPLYLQSRAQKYFYKDVNYIDVYVIFMFTRKKKTSCISWPTFLYF